MRACYFVFFVAILRAQDPNAGLIAHWRFDDREGSIAMDSANPGKYIKNINTDQFSPDYGKYPGQIYGAKWGSGQIVGGLSFDGHARVITPAVPTGPAFTISAWVNPDAGMLTTQYAYPRIVENQYDTGWYLGLDMTGKRFKFIGASGAGSTGTCGDPFGCVVGGTPKGGVWQLVTGTYDGAIARLYVDGFEVAHDTAAIPPKTLPVFIGDYYGLPDYYGWRGGIDDVRIYGRALGPSEVLGLFNQASNTRLPPLVISGMKCKESSFLGRDTRAMTCAMVSQNTAWRGSLQLKLEHADPNIIQPPINYAWPVMMNRDGKYAVNAVAIYDKPGVHPKVLGVDFYGSRAAAEWYSHTEPRAVLVQALDAPCPAQIPCASGLYPPPIVITEMRCEAAAMDADTQSVTCGIAANQPVYSGTLRISYNDGTTEDERVTVEQPMIDGKLQYWGVTGVAANSSQPIESVSFGAESPIANWTPETTTPYPPPPGKKQQSIWCRWFHWGCK